MSQELTGQQKEAMEDYIDESLDPVMDALEKMQDRHTKDATKTVAALKAVEELEKQIQSIGASGQELQTLSAQQRQLDKQLQRLAQTTVGTKEYDAAQKAVAETISSLVQMLSDMGPAMRGIQKTLHDLAAMYKATLEVAKHPVRLSDKSAQSVSQGLTRQLSTSLSSEVKPVVETSFKRVETSIERSVNEAVARLEEERARLAKELEKVSAERKELAEAIEKDTERINNTKRFALWSVLAALLASVGFVTIGGLGVGVMTFLGIPDGLGTIWGHVAGAETWYGTIGWLIVTMTVMGLIVSPMVYLAAKLIGDRD